MKETPRPPSVVSRDRQPSYTRPGSSLPSRGKEGSERARRGGERGRFMNGESGLRAGPATPGGRRGASRPRDPSGDDRGSERPGRWAWALLSCREVVSSFRHPCRTVCPTGEGPGLAGGTWVSNASLDRFFFNQKFRPVN